MDAKKAELARRMREKELEGQYSSPPPHYMSSNAPAFMTDVAQPIGIDMKPLSSAPPGFSAPRAPLPLPPGIGAPLLPLTGDPRPLPPPGPGMPGNRTGEGVRNLELRNLELQREEQHRSEMYKVP